MTPDLNRATLYLRVSTKHQANERYGLDVQRESCMAHAVANGLTVTAIYEDKGKSGTKDETKRPGLAALLAAVEANEIDSVIVSSVDRIGRKTTLVLSLVERITSAGVALISVKENLNTSTPMGQFVLTILAGLAQLERDTIVERTTAGRDLRGKLDGEKGGRIHYGYVRSEDTVAIDDFSADVVRDIFALHHMGLSLRAIAAHLTERGIKPPKGTAWYASSVKSILSNETAYRGGKRGESDVVWPNILS
ncbi:MAG: recombinase family protein [Chloroflexota bacterium]